MKGERHRGTSPFILSELRRCKLCNLSSHKNERGQKAEHKIFRLCRDYSGKKYAPNDDKAAPYGRVAVDGSMPETPPRVVVCWIVDHSHHSSVPIPPTSTRSIGRKVVLNDRLRPTLRSCNARRRPHRRSDVARGPGRSIIRSIDLRGASWPQPIERARICRKAIAGGTLHPFERTSPWKTTQTRKSFVNVSKRWGMWAGTNRRSPGPKGTSSSPRENVPVPVATM